MKRLLIIVTCLILILCLTGCSYANNYTEEEHYERVEKLLKKRYINDSTEYTGYQLFPVYNEKDELRYFLIELEPYGYVYVKIVEKSMPLFAYGMYLRDEGQPWSRFTYGEFDEETRQYKLNYELDENGEKIVYDVSPFKAANVLGEKKYILHVDLGGYRDTIVAVKRGDRYLNLVSMQEFDYVYEINNGEQPTHHIGFITKKYFNL